MDFSAKYSPLNLKNRFDQIFSLNFFCTKWSWLEKQNLKQEFQSGISRISNIFSKICSNSVDPSKKLENLQCFKAFLFHSKYVKFLHYNTIISCSGTWMAKRSKFTNGNEYLWLCSGVHIIQPIKVRLAMAMSPFNLRLILD